MGRTGTLFASEQDGVRPDITCIAKGLGAGYQPIGAMLCSGEIYAAIEGGSGFFQHGHSYIGHPVATAAGLACYPMAGTIDGRAGDHILLAPPFILEDAQIDEIADKLQIALKAVL